MQVKPSRQLETVGKLGPDPDDIRRRAEWLLGTYDHDRDGKVELDTRVPDDSSAAKLKRDETRELIVVEYPYILFDGPLAAFRGADELGNGDHKVSRDELFAFGMANGVDSLNDWGLGMWSPDGTYIESTAIYLPDE